MTYKTSGVCCQEINVEMDNGTIAKLEFVNGCHGSLQGIAKLAVGRTIDEVIPIVKGIDCRGRGTSCPDQLALALQSLKA